MGKFKKRFIGLSKSAQATIVSVVAIVGLGTYGTIAAPALETSSINNVKTADEKPPVVTTEMITTTDTIPFSKKIVETNTLSKGITQVTKTGVNGVKTSIFMVTKVDGTEKNRVLAKENITTPPVDEVISIGTYVAPTPAPRVASNCDPNYSPCVPNVSYDLDCSDIGFKVTVIGSDPHSFDADYDSQGCESY